MRVQLAAICAPVCALLLAVSCSTPQPAHKQARVKETKEWFGVHIFSPLHDGVPALEKAISESLAPMGVNVVVLEVNYRFAYQSHPELAGAAAPMTKEDARRLHDVCVAHRIRLIPQFNCLGHQSMGGTVPLLAKNPQFDETPWVPADNRGIYCRSWCPSNPDVYPIVFSLIDELIDAFQADAFHVGMDEVFLIADSKCPRCAGKNPADLFARAVNDIHHHVVDEKGLTMLMWGDRLLDHNVMKYNTYESSDNGTAPAIAKIPRDIVVCDWHYTRREEYPSVTYFQEQGFRVWPSSWRSPSATQALYDFSHAHKTDKMLGHLCTSWCDADQLSAVVGALEMPAGTNDTIKGVVESLRVVAAAEGKKK